MDFVARNADMTKGRRRIGIQYDTRLGHWAQWVHVGWSGRGTLIRVASGGRGIYAPV
jgi:hypothetical protein